MDLLFSSDYSALDWAVIAFLLVALVYVYLTWTFTYWKKHGLPFVEPTLFFGCLKDSVLAKKTIGEVYQDIYWKLAGHSYGGFFKFRQPAVMLRDPEVIKTVLVKEFASFHDNDFHVDQKVDPMFGRNPFVLVGDRWKVVRSQLTPSFTASKVKPLFPLMMDVCRDMVTYVEQQPGARDPDGLEAKELAAKFTTDVVATTVFGVQGNSFKDPNADFRRMGKLILEPNFWKGLQHTCIILMPKLADFFGFKFISDEVANFFRKMVKDVMTYREENKVKRNDFMHQLIKLKIGEGVADGSVAGKANGVVHEQQSYTDEDIAAHATIFFTDGFETSSAVMSFALYELAMNLDVQQRLRDEVTQALRQHGELNFETVNGLPLLDMVLSESMRKHPPVMFLNRLCTKPFNLPTPSGGSITVEVGTPMVVPVLALQWDPEYYPEPESFIPERFSEENKQSLNKYTYLPFGEGPRICLGSRFALAQTKVGIATLVSQFDIKPCRRTCSRVEPDPNYFLLASKHGLWLNFIKRSDK